MSPTPGRFRFTTVARAPLRTLAMGDGPPVVVFHGYGMRPETYAGLARLLAARGRRVVIPDLFSLTGRWTGSACAEAVEEIVGRLGLGPALMLAHSFGGAVQLGLASGRPDLVECLVFTDTLGLSREWALAREAVHPTTLIRLATPKAALSFIRSWTSYPASLVRAAWWGFVSDRRHQVRRVRELGMCAHVLWAERDTLLSRTEGQAFARDMGASFALVRGRPGGGPVDHDYLFRHPELAVRHLTALGLV